jgi:ribosomal protein S18 acetylase RimI-like enzyme
VEVDGQVVGSGQLTLHRREGEIGSLVVSPTHREQGIGQALLDALIREAGKRGAQAIEIAAGSDASWVQAWYLRKGFAPLTERTMPDGERIVALRMSL